MELLRADTQAGDSVLKLLWHHSDAIMCCSLKANVISASVILYHFHLNFCFVESFVFGLRMSGILSACGCVEVMVSDLVLDDSDYYRAVD